MIETYKRIFNNMSCESNNYAGTPPELNFLLTALEDVNSKPHPWSSKEIQSQLPIDILLLTAGDDGFTACYSYMKQIQRSYCEELGMVDFGRFVDDDDHNVKVALMRREQGWSATQIAVTNAAKVLCPKVTLLVGICETLKPKKAKLGDVVISAKLASYDNRNTRPDGTVEFNGPKPKVSRNMALLIPYAADGWKPPLKDPNSLQVKVHREALMLSGSDSISNCERLQELIKKNFPDALVVEMQGIGLYTAANDLNMEWAIIKGVSDLADGSEEVAEAWERFSSAMAASVVHNMFKFSLVLQEWLRCNKAEDSNSTHHGLMEQFFSSIRNTLGV